MFATKFKALLVGAVVAVGSIGVTSEANACWWRHSCGNPCWGTGCTVGYSYAPAYYSYAAYYPSCYDSCCGGGWYTGYRYGAVRRGLLGHCRYYYAGSCCYTACGCYGGGYACGPVGSYGYAAGCCGGSGDVIINSPMGGGVQTPTPAQPADATPTLAPTPPTPPAPPSPPSAPQNYAPPGGGFNMPPMDSTMPGGTTQAPTPADSGLLTIYVPADAKVTVNGYETKSIGSRRQYVSYGLRTGLSYKYEIKAEIVRDGQLHDDVKTVVITAGSRNTVAFGFNLVNTEALAAN
jgi:uncharacterized protein (TIGR03000 family)